MTFQCRCIVGNRCEGKTRKANQICRYCDGEFGCARESRRLARKKVAKRGK